MTYEVEIHEWDKRGVDGQTVFITAQTDRPEDDNVGRIAALNAAEGEAKKNGILTNSLGGSLAIIEVLEDEVA